MCGVAKKHLVDGRWVTVEEIAAEIGLTRQQMYSIIWYRKCSLQTAVTLVRTHQIFNGGNRADVHWVDGRWMTAKECADMLGITTSAIQDWRYAHKRPDGKMPLMSEAVAAYRTGQVKRGGSRPKYHKVKGREITVKEAADRVGVGITTLRSYMHKRGVSLATAMRYYEAKKQRRAEQAILNILRGM